MLSQAGAGVSRTPSLFKPATAPSALLQRRLSAATPASLGAALPSAGAEHAAESDSEDDAWAEAKLRRRASAAASAAGQPLLRAISLRPQAAPGRRATVAAVAPEQAAARSEDSEEERWQRLRSRAQAGSLAQGTPARVSPLPPHPVPVACALFAKQADGSAEQLQHAACLQVINPCTWVAHNVFVVPCRCTGRTRTPMAALGARASCPECPRGKAQGCQRLAAGGTICSANAAAAFPAQPPRHHAAICRHPDRPSAPPGLPGKSRCTPCQPQPVPWGCRRARMAAGAAAAAAAPTIASREPGRPCGGCCCSASAQQCPTAGRSSIW